MRTKIRKLLKTNEREIPPSAGAIDPAKCDSQIVDSIQLSVSRRKFLTRETYAHLTLPVRELLNRGLWKYCSRCEEGLPRYCFHRDRGQGDGLNRWCKGCRKAQQ